MAELSKSSTTGMSPEGQETSNVSNASARWVMRRGRAAVRIDRPIKDGKFIGGEEVLASRDEAKGLLGG